MPFWQYCNLSAGVPTPQGTSDTATVHTESGHGMSSDTDNNGTHGNKSGSDYTPPPSPILDMSVLDCQLGLKERDWEITYRENWEPYDCKDNPRISTYKANLNFIHRNSAESAVDDSDCMLPLSYVRQFIFYKSHHISKELTFSWPISSPCTSHNKPHTQVTRSQSISSLAQQ